MKLPEKDVKKWLAGILIAGFMLRIAFCFFLSLPHQHTDTHMYFDQAQALLAGKYINYAPNGYPLILALFLKLFTADTLITALLRINIVLGTFTIWMVFRIAFLTFRDTQVALIAAALIAFYPNQLNYTRWILTEIPCTFFIVACFYFYFKNYRFTGGLMLGISVLFRTPFLPVGFLIAGYELLFVRKVPFKLLAGLILPLILLASYCYVVTGKFSITGNETVNVVYAVSSYTPETKGEIDWDAPDRHPEITTSSEAWNLYFTHASNHPLQFLQQRFSSLWELWGFYPSSLGGSRGTGARMLIGLCNLLLISCSIWCFFKFKNSKQVILLLFPVISLSGIYILLVSMARYTVPMEPFLIILAAFPLTSIIRMINFKHTPVESTHLAST